MRVVSDDDPLLELELRIKNCRLRQRRAKMGLTQVQLSLLAGVSKWTVSQYENLYRNPVNPRTGEWNNSALKLADALKCKPDTLWPEVIHHVRKSKATKLLTESQVERAVAALSMAEEERLALPSPEDVVDSQALTARINRLLLTVRPREADVLRRRFGLQGEEEQTLNEVADAFGVTRERVRQLESKALRKLRHPSRLRQVKGYYDPDWEVEQAERWNLAKHLANNGIEGAMVDCHSESTTHIYVDFTNHDGEFSAKLDRRSLRVAELQEIPPAYTHHKPHRCHATGEYFLDGIRCWDCVDERSYRCEYTRVPYLEYVEQVLEYVEQVLEEQTEGESNGRNAKANR